MQEALLSKMMGLTVCVPFQVLCALDADPNLCIPFQLQPQQPQMAGPPQPCSLWRSGSLSCTTPYDAAFHYQQMPPAAVPQAQCSLLSMQPLGACREAADPHAVLQPSRVQMATPASSPPASWPANSFLSSMPESGASSSMRRQHQLQQHIEQPTVQDAPVRSVAPGTTVPWPVGVLMQAALHLMAALRALHSQGRL